MSYDFVSLHPPYRQIFDCNHPVAKIDPQFDLVYN